MLNGLSVAAQIECYDCSQTGWLCFVINEAGYVQTHMYVHADIQNLVINGEFEEPQMTSFVSTAPGQTLGGWTQVSTGAPGEYMGFFNGNLAPAFGRQCYHVHSSCGTTGIML